MLWKKIDICLLHTTARIISSIRSARTWVCGVFVCQCMHLYEMLLLLLWYHDYLPKCYLTNGLSFSAFVSGFMIPMLVRSWYPAEPSLHLVWLISSIWSARPWDYYLVLYRYMNDLFPFCSLWLSVLRSLCVCGVFVCQVIQHM